MRLCRLQRKQEDRLIQALEAFEAAHTHSPASTPWYRRVLRVLQCGPCRADDEELPPTSREAVTTPRSPRIASSPANARPALAGAEGSRAPALGALAPHYSSSGLFEWSDDGMESEDGEEGGSGPASLSERTEGVVVSQVRFFRTVAAAVRHAARTVAAAELVQTTTMNGRPQTLDTRAGLNASSAAAAASATGVASMAAAATNASAGTPTSEAELAALLAKREEAALGLGAGGAGVPVSGVSRRRRERRQRERQEAAGRALGAGRTSIPERFGGSPNLKLRAQPAVDEWLAGGILV